MEIKLSGSDYSRILQYTVVVVAYRRLLSIIAGLICFLIIYFIAHINANAIGEMKSSVQCRTALLNVILVRLHHFIPSMFTSFSFDICYLKSCLSLLYSVIVI